MINRIQLIAQAAKRVQSEQQSKQLKLSGIVRQAVMLSDREYTDKKSVDSVRELMF